MFQSQSLIAKLAQFKLDDSRPFDQNQSIDFTIPQLISKVNSLDH